MSKIQAAAVSYEVARLRAISSDNWPHLGMALLAVSAYKTESIDTAAVDEWWRVYYNPEFIAKCDAQQAAAVFVHEIWHVLRFHFIRARGVGVTRETAMLWNYVADAEIHTDQTVLQSLEGIKDAKPVTVDSFDPPLDPRETSEAWYLDVLNRPTTKKVLRPNGAFVYVPLMKGGYPEVTDGSGTPGWGGGGSGSSGVPGPWEFPAPSADDRETPAGISVERGGVIQRAVAEAVRQHCRSRGTGAAGLLRWAEEVLDPKVDWRTRFQTAFHGVMAPIAGTQHWTWSRPARRQSHDPRVVQPGWCGTRRRVAVIIDTSGSMSDTMLSRCRTEVTQMIASVVTNGREPAVHVYTCDTRVTEAQKVWTGADVQMIGGGGTDLTIAFDRAAADMESGDFEFDIVVAMTDGYTPWPAEPFRIPVITLLLSEGTHPAWLNEDPHQLVKIDPE